MNRPLAVATFIGIVAAAGGCHDASAPNPVSDSPVAERVADLVCKPPLPDDQILLPIAPVHKRIDLVVPTFSNPTTVTNPLFPISSLAHAVLVGLSGGERFRAETTLLPSTQTIDLGGITVKTLVSQYVGYVDGRIHETALDWYAQADDGSVWYFGEDVANYQDGKIADTDGTWLACKDGPAAMIMPAPPKVGDVFRVENIYPTVFEEVEITGVGLTLPGPLGPVSGAITVQQLHLDSSYAPKDFAPGYGEFSTGSGASIEALAVAIPVNSAAGGSPRDLSTVLDGARRIYEAAIAGKWQQASRTARGAREAWRRFAATKAVPRLLEPLITAALDDLATGVEGRDDEATRRAAIEVERSGLDVLVRYRPRAVVDYGRMAMFARQLQLDAEGEDRAGVAGDLAVLDIILDRLIVGGNREPDGGVRRLRKLVAEIRGTSERGDFSGVLARTRRLQKALSDAAGD